MEIQKLLEGMEKMHAIHKTGSTCYEQTGGWDGRAYGWHEPLFPPEYRRCYLKGDIFEPNAASDLYYFAACYYKKITGRKPPCNFEIDRLWKKRFAACTAKWKEPDRKAVFDMIVRCTRWKNEKRTQDAGEVLETILTGGAGEYDAGVFKRWDIDPCPRGDFI